MTKYEQTMYERDLPGIRESLESIAKTLKSMENIISDPGDEVEHITDYPASIFRTWGNESSISSPDYEMD